MADQEISNWFCVGLPQSAAVDRSLAFGVYPEYRDFGLAAYQSAKRLGCLDSTASQTLTDLGYISKQLASLVATP